MINCLIVGLGGAVGTILRYLIGLIPLKESLQFPIKTFVINIIGCFLIGCIVTLALKINNFNPKLILFLKVGVCGGFTTFSTFALEANNLIKTSHWGIAVTYIILSIIIGIFAVFLGQWLIDKIS